MNKIAGKCKYRRSIEVYARSWGRDNVRAGNRIDKKKTFRRYLCLS
jgi:hypothetical protein